MNPAPVEMPLANYCQGDHTEVLLSTEDLVYLGGREKNSISGVGLPVLYELVRRCHYSDWGYGLVKLFFFYGLRLVFYLLDFLLSLWGVEFKGFTQITQPIDSTIYYDVSNL